jgi:hypothetical protein
LEVLAYLLPAQTVLFLLVDDDLTFRRNLLHETPVVAQMEGGVAHCRYNCVLKCLEEGLDCWHEVNALILDYFHHVVVLQMAVQFVDAGEYCREAACCYYLLKLADLQHFEYEVMRDAMFRPLVDNAISKVLGRLVIVGRLIHKYIIIRQIKIIKLWIT